MYGSQADHSKAVSCKAGEYGKANDKKADDDGNIDAQQTRTCTVMLLNKLLTVFVLSLEGCTSMTCVYMQYCNINMQYCNIYMQYCNIYIHYCNIYMQYCNIYMLNVL